MKILGIADLYPSCTTPPDAEVWNWCRRHEQAHKVGERCRCTCDPVGWRQGVHTLGCPTQTPSHCIDVGPFMSEREAQRLNQIKTNSYGAKPLGMEVE